MINLFYYNNGNFGDELSPYIVEKLSGDKVRFCNPFSLRKMIRNSLSAFHLLFKGDLSNINSLFITSLKPTIIAVGSLLEHSNNHSICWGTGMAQKDARIPRNNKGRYIMTRGFLSQKRIEELGNHVEIKDVTGDPAFLLPLIYHPHVEKKFSVGLIPHTSHYKELKSEVDKLGLCVLVINLHTTNVEECINDLLSCKVIVSTSLHGLIVSHAYGIPAIWAKYKDLVGGAFKFYDYFSSVGITSYKPQNIEDYFKIRFLIGTDDLKKYCISNDVVERIQRALIENAPFNVLDKYRYVKG